MPLRTIAAILLGLAGLAFTQTVTPTTPRVTDQHRLFDEQYESDLRQSSRARDEPRRLSPQRRAR